MIKAKIPAEDPNSPLGPYSKAARNFSWEAIKKEFTWFESGKVNIVHEALDRWGKSPETEDQKALVFEKGQMVVTLTYRMLMEISCRWAAMLLQLGFRAGDRLFIFLHASPELYYAMLGCARIGVIFCPIFTTLGIEELEERIRDAEPKGILTHPDLAERLPFDSMPSVEYLIYTEGILPRYFPGEVLASEIIKTMPPWQEPEWLKEESPLYLIYTSGSTGPPKGVLHTHKDMTGHLATGRYVLSLNNNSVLWTDGDPAWVTGTIYGTFVPWLCGATSVVQGAPFSASTWYRTLERYGVTVWYTTPMTIRKLMEAGDDLPTRYDFSRLNHVSAVGEALLPELFYWFKERFRLSPHDTWWMSETGMICIANFPFMDLKPGSMGKPVPGIDASILDEAGESLPLMSMGELALKVPWPALMAGIWKDRPRYELYFRHKGWFLTGDMALKDEEGYFYHQGRVDDLIKIGEKMIGPYDIEQILCRHPAVCEAAVISKANKGGQPSLKAFITLSRAFTPSNRLNQEIRAFVKANLSPDVPLKEVEFMDSLPRTKAGKLLRRVLRARELGIPAGDPSNMKE
ncbi:MAG: acyl-CoA synthetase [Desulfobacteraceae bacterium]|jgi:acetyl-CoA synthetase|nr:MAG: acyl-CoA synthetase [Desulfobacteraceae bacterium]